MARRRGCITPRRSLSRQALGLNMKNTNLAEFTGGAGRPSHQYVFRALTADDCDELGHFYRELSFDERRQRFGGARSDAMLDAFCRAIEWRRTIMIACLSSTRLEAVLEIYQAIASWRCCEIALACRLAGDTGVVVAQLLQLAAFTAGKLGCREFVVPLDENSRMMFPLPENTGRVRSEAFHALIDLGAYGSRRRPAA
jgi:hypothetical protein